MRTTKLTLVLLATLTLSVMGCGGSEFQLASVSGKVTYDGQPVPGIRVVFQPRAVKGNAIAGPWSSGLTNESGEYRLVTRYDNRGAMVANHDVSFAYDDQESLEDLKYKLEDARGEAEEVERIKKRIEMLKATAKTQKLIPEGLSREFTVSTSGSDAANFELSSGTKEETDETAE